MTQNRTGWSVRYVGHFFCDSGTAFSCAGINFHQLFFSTLALPEMLVYLQLTSSGYKCWTALLMSPALGSLTLQNLTLPSLPGKVSSIIASSHQVYGRCSFFSSTTLPSFAALESLFPTLYAVHNSRRLSVCNSSKTCPETSLAFSTFWSTPERSN